MNQIQADDNRLDPSLLGEYWEALKAVRSLRGQACRWKDVIDTGDIPGLYVFLDEAERSLDPFLDVLDRMIRKETPDDLSTLGPLPPILGSIDSYRKLLLRQARRRLQSMINQEEAWQVPLCEDEDTDRFADVIIRWYYQTLRTFPRALLGDIETEQQDHVPNEDPEKLLRATRWLLDELVQSETGYKDDYLYTMMGIDAPETASSRQERHGVAARAQVILSEAGGLPEGSLREYAYLTGKWEEIRAMCRTLRGFQDAVIGRARQELASIEEQLERLSVGQTEPNESTTDADVLASGVDPPSPGRDTIGQTAQPES